MKFSLLFLESCKSELGSIRSGVLAEKLGNPSIWSSDIDGLQYHTVPYSKLIFRGSESFVYLVHKYLKENF